MATASATSSTPPSCRRSCADYSIMSNLEATMLKWFPAVMTLCGYALSLAVYRQLPSDVTVDLARLLPMTWAAQADVVPRSVVAFGLPSLALLVFLLLHEAPVSRLGRAAARLFPISDGSGERRPVEYHKFAPSYRLIVSWVVMLVLSMH